MVKKKAGEPTDYDFAKRALERMFKEAKANGEELWPDDAMRRLMKFTKTALELEVVGKDIIESIGRQQIDLIAIARKTHIYAVTLFYETYMPRKGAPRLNEEHGARLLEMHNNKGMSYRDIALHEEPNLKTADEIEKAAGKYRKRIAAMRKRQKLL